MENLIEILEEECREYEGLLQLSQHKTSVIVSGDLQNLQRITDEEQEFVSRIANLDKKRETVTADVANVINRDVRKLKLAHLVTVLEKRPAEQQRLAAIHDRLQQSAKELQRVNEQNKELLDNALEMVNFEMNLLHSVKAAPETAKYNRGAYSVGETIGTNRRFDAKQ